MIRVLVADDHMVVRTGLAAVIGHETDMTLVAEAASGPEVLSLARLHRPDVVVMDLRMPGPPGEEVIAALVAENKAARIIVVTIHKGDEAAYRALRAGARGYLLKDVPTEDIVAAIRTVHAGGTCIPPAVATTLAQRLGRAELSPRETQVLKLIAVGYSNREVAAELGVAEATAEKHMTSVLQKLGAKDRTHAVRLALERGIVDLET
jgi:two-component system, NarL family, response regulator